MAFVDLDGLPVEAPATGHNRFQEDLRRHYVQGSKLRLRRAAMLMLHESHCFSVQELATVFGVSVTGARKSISSTRNDLRRIFVEKVRDSPRFMRGQANDDARSTSP